MTTRNQYTTSSADVASTPYLPTTVRDEYPSSQWWKLTHQPRRVATCWQAGPMLVDKATGAMRWQAVSCGSWLCDRDCGIKRHDDVYRMIVSCFLASDNIHYAKVGDYGNLTREEQKTVTTNRIARNAKRRDASYLHWQDFDGVLHVYADRSLQTRSHDTLTFRELSPADAVQHLWQRFAFGRVVRKPTTPNRADTWDLSENRDECSCSFTDDGDRITDGCRVHEKKYVGAGFTEDSGRFATARDNLLRRLGETGLESIPPSVMPPETVAKELAAEYERLGGERDRGEADGDAEKDSPNLTVINGGKGAA